MVGQAYKLGAVPKGTQKYLGPIGDPCYNGTRKPNAILVASYFHKSRQGTQSSGGFSIGKALRRPSYGCSEGTPRLYAHIGEVNP